MRAVLCLNADIQIQMLTRYSILEWTRGRLMEYYGSWEIDDKSPRPYNLGTKAKHIEQAQLWSATPPLLDYLAYFL